ILQWQALVTGENGLILAGLSVAFAVAADRMRAANAWCHGVMYAGAAALTMTVALLQVGCQAAVLPTRAAAVTAVAAVGCWVLAHRWTYPTLRQLTCALVPLTTLAA